MAGSIVAQSKTHHPGNSKLEDPEVSGNDLDIEGLEFIHGVYIQFEQVPRRKGILGFFSHRKEPKIIGIWEPVDGDYKKAHPITTMYHKRDYTSE